MSAGSAALSFPVVWVQWSLSDACPVSPRVHHVTSTDMAYAIQDIHSNPWQLGTQRYLTWWKPIQYMLVEHPVAKPWALIWSWSPFLFWEGLPLDFRMTPFGLVLIQPQEYQSGWVLMCSRIRGAGTQSMFQFIPKVFSWVEVRALCRPLKVFHSHLVKPRLYGAYFGHFVKLWFCEGKTARVIQSPHRSRLVVGQSLHLFTCSHARYLGYSYRRCQLPSVRRSAHIYSM